MYTGTLALYMATPVALGSWRAALSVIALVPMFILRIRNEEEVLRREWPGYEEYRRKGRYRPVRFVW